MKKILNRLFFCTDKPQRNGEERDRDIPPRAHRNPPRWACILITILAIVIFGYALFSLMRLFHELIYNEFYYHRSVHLFYIR